MFELCGAAAILLAYIVFIVKPREAKPLPPPLPEPIKEDQHPYQKLIDSVSADAIQKIKEALKDNEFQTDTMKWRDTFPQPIKKEILKRIRNEFSHYENTLEFKFLESSMRLRIKLIPK